MRSLAFFLLFSALAFAQTTPNLGLNIPNYNTPDWKLAMNQNFIMLDGYLSGGTALPGVTVDGTATFTGLADVKNLNGVQKCDQFPGATLDVQLNACIAAAVINSVGAQGIADATGLRTGTIAAQVDVGNTAGTGYATLLLPTYATWGVSITNGTSCGIMLHNKSAMVGMGSAGAGNVMVINSASNETNVNALVCTDPATTGGNYIRAENFQVNNGALGTMATAELVAQDLDDASFFSNITVGGSNGTAMKVIGACCGTTFEKITVDCGYVSGCQPLTIGGTTTGTYVDEVSFINNSIDHPGSGLNNIVIGASAGNEGINFYNLYMEPNYGDLTTPYIEIGANANNINIYGGMASYEYPGSTACMVDIASWSGPANHTFVGLKSQLAEGTCVINDHVTGQTIVGDPNYGANALYVSGAPTFSSLRTNTVYQTTASQWAGTSACSSSTKAITLPITYTSQPAIFVFDETTKGGANLSAKSTSGFTVSCSGASDAFDWMAIGNPN